MVKLQFKWRFYCGVGDAEETGTHVFTVKRKTKKLVGEYFKENLHEFWFLAPEKDKIDSFTFGMTWYQSYPEDLGALLVTLISQIGDSANRRKYRLNAPNEPHGFSRATVVGMLSELTDEEIYDVFINDYSMEDGRMDYTGTLAVCD